MKRAIILSLGFFLFISGFLSLILMMTGLKLSFLGFLDFFGRGFGFLLRLLMIIGGIVMIYLLNIEEEEELGEDEELSI
jgi:hypothetical protein